MKLKKSQKVIVLLSGAWVVTSLLVAGNVASDNYENKFHIMEFITSSLIFSSPIIAYWAGVWVWGIGYVIRAIKWLFKTLWQLRLALAVIVALLFISAVTVHYINSGNRKVIDKIINSYVVRSSKIEKLRQKYPQYAELEDQQLVDIIYRKFYSDVPRYQFNTKLDQLLFDTDVGITPSKFHKQAASWNQVKASSEFQALTSAEQEAARQQYFNNVIAPNVPQEEWSIALSQFDSKTKIQPQLLTDKEVLSGTQSGQSDVPDWARGNETSKTQNPFDQLDAVPPVKKPIVKPPTQLLHCIKMVEAKRPYSTMPAHIALTVSNSCNTSFSTIIVGWQNDLTSVCSTNPRDYAGLKNFSVNLDAMDSTVLEGDLSAAARHFCLLEAH